MKLVEDMDKRVRVKAKKQSFVLISEGRGDVSNFLPRHRPILKKRIRACGPSLVVSRSISSIDSQPQLSESVKVTLFLYRTIAIILKDHLLPKLSNLLTANLQ